MGYSWNFETDYTTGFSGGITYDYFINKNIFVGIDILYEQRGFQRDARLTNGLSGIVVLKNHFLYNYDYLMAPIRLGFSYGKKFNFSAAVGVAPAFLVHAKRSFPSFIVPNSTFILPPENIITTDSVSKFDFNGFGELRLGYRYKNKVWFYTSFSYQQSFTPLIDKYFHPFFGEQTHYSYLIRFGISTVLRDSKKNKTSKRGLIK